MPATETRIVGVLMDRYGRTYAEEAGILLGDRPQPLYKLLVLATLLSARISADISASAARELFAAGYRSPAAMRDASWLDRVKALSRGRYKRFDERTATMLGDGADLLAERWSGDLRKLHREGEGEPRRLAALLTEFPGIGPAGADIFLREVQGVWPDVAPYLDKRVLAGAALAGLPGDAAALAELAGPGDRLVHLAAALVRVSLSRRAAEELVAASGGTS